MIVSVEIPDPIAKQFHLDEVAQSGALLEAFLLQQYTAGELTAGQVGSALGKSFTETEQFLFDHNAPAGLGPEEHSRGVTNLHRALTR